VLATPGDTPFREVCLLAALCDEFSSSASMRLTKKLAAEAKGVFMILVTVSELRFTMQAGDTIAHQ
jgi:hypothetical protein